MSDKKKKEEESKAKAIKIKTEALKLKIEIKKAEAKKNEKKVKVLPKEAKVSFDTWYHSRAAKIPKQHMKEILAVDFKARKLSDLEKAEDYDKALEQYGVKLN